MASQPSVSALAGGGRLAALQQAMLSHRNSAISDGGAALPGTRTLTRRQPLGGRGAPGTRASAD
jgi:hypothetical protein